MGGDTITIPDFTASFTAALNQIMTQVVSILPDVLTVAGVLLALSVAWRFVRSFI